MKRALLSIGVLLIFSACGSSATVIREMTITSTDTSKTAELLKGAERVIVRRLAAASITKNVSASAVPNAEQSATLTVTVPDGAAAEKVHSILDEPFTFDIRTEEPANDPSDPTKTEWKLSGIEGQDLQWVRVVHASDGSIGIELLFSETGRTKLATVLTDNVGKSIGIFVRDLLVSSLTIKKGGISDHIVIDGVPSDMVAQIFADDVNVGLHVTFAPAR